MKQNIKSSYFGLLLIAAMMFTVSSCKKNTLVETPGSTGPYNTLGDFYSQNAVPMQTYIINPQVSNTVTGTQGTTFSAAANTVVDSVGNPPSGNVTVQLMEIYNVKDMILSNKQTTFSGQLLQSAGAFYIRFVANGIQYKPTNMQVSMPNPNPSTGMNVFYGTVGTNEINWSISGTTTQVSANSYGYAFALTNSVPYNWVSCNKYYQSPGSKTTVTISAQAQGGTSETVTMNFFLAFKTINSVMGVYTPLSANTYTASNIPVGMQASVVGIGVGKLTKKSYFGKINTTVTASQSVSLTLTPMIAEQIKTELQTL